MPIVTIAALPAPAKVVQGLLARLVEEVAAALGGSIDDVWAHYLPVAAQRIGTRLAGERDQCPVVVVRGRNRGSDAIAAGLAAAAHAVSAELGVSIEDVWVQWIDVESGRAYAGGALL